MATLLIAAGADVSALDSDGESPLFLALESDSEDLPCVRMLLAAGCEVNRHRQSDRVTPLHSAVARRSRFCVRLLLAAGSNVNARDRDGNTALHWAGRLESLDCAVALVEAGANKKLVNKVPAQTSLAPKRQACTDRLSVRSRLRRAACGPRRRRKRAA